MLPPDMQANLLATQANTIARLLDDDHRFDRDTVVLAVTSNDLTLLADPILATAAAALRGARERCEPGDEMAVQDAFLEALAGALVWLVLDDEV